MVIELIIAPHQNQTEFIVLFEDFFFICEGGGCDDFRIVLKSSRNVGSCVAKRA